MASHKLNPKPGETWMHPLTFNYYTIHSLTDDGWVRFHTGSRTIPLYTMPTLEFIQKYKRFNRD